MGVRPSEESMLASRLGDPSRVGVVASVSGGVEPSALDCVPTEEELQA